MAQPIRQWGLVARGKSLTLTLTNVQCANTDDASAGGEGQLALGRQEPSLASLGAPRGNIDLQSQGWASGGWQGPGDVRSSLAVREKSSILELFQSKDSHHCQPQQGQGDQVECFDPRWACVCLGLHPALCSILMRMCAVGYVFIFILAKVYIVDDLGTRRIRERTLHPEVGGWNGGPSSQGQLWADTEPFLWAAFPYP